MITRLLAAPLCGAAVLLAPAAPAAAQAYPPAGGVTVAVGEVSDEEVEPGQPVRLRAAGFVPGRPVQVTVSGRAVRQVAADGDGRVDVALTPTGPGQHVVTATGPQPEGGTRIVNASVEVLGPGGSAGAGALPSGLLDVLPGLLRGLLVVAVGALGVLALRLARRPVPLDG